jgi:hypothetical protein
MGLFVAEMNTGNAHLVPKWTSGKDADDLSLIYQGSLGLLLVTVEISSLMGFMVLAAE